MENKKDISKILKDIEESEAFKSQRKLLEEKRKTLKPGPNVIHLDYSGQYTTEELKTISDILNLNDLELSSYDRSGIIMNSVDDFIGYTIVVLNTPIVQNILKDVVKNTAWETIKLAFTKILLLSKNRVTKKVSTNEIKESNIKIAISCKTNTNNEYRFDFEGITNESEIDGILDKTLVFLSEQTKNDEYCLPEKVEFSKKKQKWVKKNKKK
ncbi:hypothetical protein I2486_15875 [Cellulophaga sp. E16_2]|uniref:hypothetical protein n=1 Tax=Cellulophaga sp. E16_2 TaxID=2789297 RepID=UPI001A9397AD|nr:hypothetical protein [Cellulophaga sp. E16_2]MBO0592883.1 hypothetical protein [Cellulophaga sp. E16_2]